MANRKMPVAAQVSLAECLKLNLKPERELIGGEVFPKPMGTLEHMSRSFECEREVFVH